MKTVFFLIVFAALTACGKAEGPLNEPNSPPKVFLQETTTSNGTPCVVASYYTSVAISCNWR